MNENIEKTMDELANAASRTLDYEVGWMFAETISKSHTTYRGKGRPRRTDYITVKHPFDGKLNHILCA